MAANNQQDNNILHTNNSDQLSEPSNEMMEILQPNGLPLDNHHHSDTSSMIGNTTANAVVRTRRGAPQKKSSVFQLVKSKTSTSGGVPAVASAQTNYSVSPTLVSVNAGNHSVNMNGDVSYETAQSSEKAMVNIPLIDLQRNSEFFPISHNPQSSNGSFSAQEETPVRENVDFGKGNQPQRKAGRLLRRIANQIRVKWRTPMVKYSLIFLLTCLIIGGITMLALRSTSPQVETPEPIVLPYEQRLKEQNSWWNRIGKVFSGSDEAVDQPAPENKEGKLLSLSHEDVRIKPNEFATMYLKMDKPFTLSKYAAKWIAASTWDSEFTTIHEFEQRMKRLQRQNTKYSQKRHVHMPLVELEVSRSVQRVPFSQKIKHEFHYDYPISLDQFSSLKRTASEIWLVKKSKESHVSSKLNPNHVVMCLIASKDKQSVEVERETEKFVTDISSNDCLYIPAKWSFNLNIEKTSKFLVWFYE